MTTQGFLERHAQHITDEVEEAIYKVSEKRKKHLLTKDEVAFFERCLAGKLMDVFTERGLMGE